jgi:hypothetical protein
VSGLALVRLDDKDEPLAPLPVASSLPSKGARVTVFYETGQLDIGRTETAVEALLSGGDVAKKLHTDAPDADAVWIELLSTFPRNVFGSVVINEAGELAGIVLLDSQGTAGSGGKALGGGGFGRGFGAVGGRSTGSSMRRVYAISVAALGPLLEKQSAAADQILFTLTASPLQDLAPAAAAARWSVKLASGETIDEKTFAVPDAGRGSGTLSYSGGSRCAVLALSERKTMEGPLIVYTPDGKELLRESLVQGRRDGPLTVFRERGECVLAAQFEHDVRHGYCAYFRNGAPWLVQELEEGRLGAQHLVKQGAVFHTISPGKTSKTIDDLLAGYGPWPDWDSRLAALEAAIERWAKDTDRFQRGGRNRPSADQLAAAQREAVAAIEEFRKLVE